MSTERKTNDRSSDKKDSKKVKWGFFGTGRIGQDFAQAIKFLDDVEIYACGASKMEHAKSFADRFKCKAYGSYEELVKDPEVEVIYINTPHNHHEKNAIMCLDAGKPVLCEKPFSVNSEQAQKMVKKAREKNLFCMEAMWSRFMPWAEKVRELISSDAIGKPQLVLVDYGIKMPDDNERIWAPELAGGGLLDLGVYGMDFAYMAFGADNKEGKNKWKAPEKIMAMGDFTDKGVDSITTISCKFGQNQFAQITSSILADTHREAHIIGPKGRIRVHGPFWSASRKITLQAEGEPDKIFMFKEMPAHGPFNYPNCEQMVYEAKEVMKCLREGKKESEVMPLDETISVLQSVDKVREMIGLKFPKEVEEA